ncbi:MAG: hypothetical protein IT581_00450 [Verrucomicrobiales bacterium]|nr:hypothetical protein [Verrucomicrobiales bacterium]
MGIRKQNLPGGHRIVLIQALVCLCVVGGHLRSEAQLKSLVGPIIGTLPVNPASTDTDTDFQSPDNWYVTGEPLDLAIEGSGYFVLRDTQSPEALPHLTRSGSFRIDIDGYMVSPSGYRVQGLAQDGVTVIDVAFPQGQSINGATPSSIMIASDGNVAVNYRDNTSRSGGRIALWQPETHTRLRRWWDDDYTDPHMAKDWRDRLGLPDGTARRLHSGFLQAPDPELQVLDFKKSGGIDTPSFPLNVGLVFCVILDGPGFLVVRDPKTNQRYVTRCGLMHRDWDGWLVTVPEGYRVQGLIGPAFSHLDDIRVDATGQPAESDEARVNYAHVQPNGDVIIPLSNGESFKRAKVWIARIPDLTGLRKFSDSLYSLPDGDGFQSATAANTEASTQLVEGSLDPRYWTSERQQWINRMYRFQQKVVSRTGVDSHLAIAGDGFFRLRDPKTGQEFLTRSGLFQWSDDGYLEGLHGWRVQGWSSTVDTRPVLDVRTHHGSRPTTLDSYQIDSEGHVMYSVPEGTQNTLAQIFLVQVPDPTILRETEPNHYQLPEGDVDFSFSVADVPGHRGLGHLLSGGLEAVWYEEYWQVHEVPDAGRLLRPRGLSGRRAKIQISGDMTNWSDWMTIDEGGKIQGGVIDFAEPSRRAVVLNNLILDTERPQGTSRFYRLQVQATSWPSWRAW